MTINPRMQKMLDSTARHYRAAYAKRRACIPVATERRSGKDRMRDGSDRRKCAAKEAA